MKTKVKTYFNYLRDGLRFGLPERLSRINFYPNIKAIADTPTIYGRNDGLVILSMVSHKDVLMYLLSVKSLEKYLHKGRFEVINDGTLNKHDIKIIKNNIHGVKFTDFQEINNTKCPKKGVWERLLYAAELSQKEQVLVVDSDIVVQGDIYEVHKCLDRNQNFILGVGQEIMSMHDVCNKELKKYKDRDTTTMNVQTYIDTHLNLIHDSQNLKYLKASNGFNGFAKGAISRQIVEEWSIRLENVFGARWHCWGTEQILACFLLANYGNSVVLQEPKYGLYYAVQGKNYDAMSVIHFIGTHRYKNRYYANIARKIVKNLIKDKQQNKN